MTLTFEAGMHGFMTLCFIVLFIYFLRRWGFHLLQWVTEAGSTKICIAIEAAQQSECACAYIYLCRCALLRLWPGLVVVHAGHYVGAGRSSTWQGGGEVAFGTGESSKLSLIETNQPGPSSALTMMNNTHTKKIKTGRLKGSKQSRKKKKS